MIDLDLLDAEYVGFDPMDLVKALPGVLKGTGEALDKSKPAAAPPAPVTVPAPPASSNLGWKVGAGVLAGAVVLLLLRR